MNLVSDYVHPVPAGGRCRIRLYLPDEKADSPVVICTEPADGTGGMSIANCAEVLAAKVIQANQLETEPVWIEHYEDGARGSEGDPHTFDLVTFSSYEAMEFVGVDGWNRRIGCPNWQALDRAAVESLIGGKVQKVQGGVNGT